jgi:hypothetical protein
LHPTNEDSGVLCEVVGEIGGEAGYLLCRGRFAFVLNLEHENKDDDGEKTLEEEEDAHGKVYVGWVASLAQAVGASDKAWFLAQRAERPVVSVSALVV